MNKIMCHSHANFWRIPIVLALFTGMVFENRSAWGAGEFLLMRTVFDVEALDCDFYRFAILANRGYRIYLNGQEIRTYGWWDDTPTYAPLPLGPNELQHLKLGSNVLAVYANAFYLENVAVGQLDVRLEGLKKADLLGQSDSIKNSP